MSRTPITIARTIATALNNMYHTHVVINTSQFYGGEGKLVRVYVIKDAFYFRGKESYSDKELFRTASGVYACLYMRDLLAAFQQKEPPKETNEGYLNVLEKKNGRAGIEYMLNTYLTGGQEDDD